METIKWYSPELKKPFNNQVIAFKPISEMDEQDLTLEGLYIEEEDMFFVGFEDASEHFYYSWGIAFWRPLDKEGIDPVRVF